MWKLGARRDVCLALAVPAALSVVAYSRALSIPLISDDYLQIQLGRDYGPISEWPKLAADVLYRCRATSILLTHWTEQVFGLTPLAFNLTSLALHILNSWLVLALGAWERIGWRVSVPAACFFAVYEGHQEAVIWYAALPELLVFFFGVATLQLWLRWRDGGPRRELWYAAAVACFALALLSKESAVAVLPILAFVLFWERLPLKLCAARLLPFAALSAVYVAMIFAASGDHYHFHDAGTFSFSAPFWIVLPASIGRLLWIWGALALVAVGLCRAWQWLPLLRASAIWVVATLLPYCFLTYMPRVPSRHTYLASAGLALWIAAGFLTLRDHFPSRQALVFGAALLVVSQWTYLWTRKHGQFLERAQPTERLLHAARQQKGELYVGCFPYPPWIAEATLQVYGLAPERLLFDSDPSGSATPDIDFCAARPQQAARRPDAQQEHSD